LAEDLQHKAKAVQKTEWLPQSDGCGQRAFSSRIRGLARAVKPGQRQIPKEEWKFGLFLFWEGFSDITNEAWVSGAAMPIILTSLA